MRKALFGLLGSLILAIGTFGQANCVTGNANTYTGTAFSKQVAQFGMGPFTLQPTAAPPVGSGGPTWGLSENNLNGLPSAPAQQPNEAVLLRQSENGFWEAFNGTSGTYTHVTAVQWTLNSPATFLVTPNITAKTYNVTITTAGGTACANGCVLASAYPFRSTAPAASLGFWNLDTAPNPITACGVALNMPNPVLSTITPNAGPLGTSVTVTGSNFGASQGNSTISFGGVAATTVSAWSAQSITATVPNTATTGSVIVTVNNLISNPMPFTITTTVNPQPPLVTSIQSAITVSLACGTNAPPPATHSVVLSWTASVSSGVTGYNVYRSTSSGSGYMKIGSTTTLLNYTDTTVSSGQTLYYVVTAVSSGGESVFSNQASATIP